jgi:hypothetical protein
MDTGMLLPPGNCFVSVYGASLSNTLFNVGQIIAGDYTIILSSFEPQRYLGPFSLQIDGSRRFEIKLILQEGAGMYNKVIKGAWWVLSELSEEYCSNKLQQERRFSRRQSHSQEISGKSVFRPKYCFNFSTQVRSENRLSIYSFF